MEVAPVHREGGHSSTGSLGLEGPIVGLWGQGDVCPVRVTGRVAVTEAHATQEAVATVPAVPDNRLDRVGVAPHATDEHWFSHGSSSLMDALHRHRHVDTSTN